MTWPKIDFNLEQHKILNATNRIKEYIMKHIFFLLLMGLLYSCSTVKTIKTGEKYVFQCHKVVTSDESCAEKANEYCSNGYKIQKSEFDYVFLKGPQRVVTVNCNK